MSETGVRERGHEIVAVFALFEVLCTIACALRVYTRLRIQTAFGLDDWFAVLAWVSGRDRLGHIGKADYRNLQALMTIFTAFVFQGVEHGAGQHQVNIPLNDTVVAMKVRHTTK
jgi:hypothetical protein